MFKLCIFLEDGIFEIKPVLVGSVKTTCDTRPFLQSPGSEHRTCKLFVPFRNFRKH